MSTTKQVAKKEEGLPAYMTQDKGMGTEDISMDDIVIPRLKICQPLSEVKQANKAMKDGSFYDSVSADELGESVNVYILLKWNSVIWFDNQKLIATQYTDAETKKVETIGIPPDGVKGISCFNYMVVLSSDLQSAIKSGVAPKILIYSASSAAQKSARKLNGILQSNGNKGVSIFANRITIGSEVVKFDKGSAFMPVFSTKKYASKLEYVALKELHIACKKMQSHESAHAETEETTIAADTIVNNNGTVVGQTGKPNSEDPFATEEE